MSCTAVTACQLAVNFKNIYHSSSVPSMLCVTPNHINQFPETYLKLASSGSTYWYRAPVCLFGDKGKSENPNKASPWEALEKAMGRFKKEQSVEDILKQQMEKQEFYDDGGSNGGIVLVAAAAAVAVVILVSQRMKALLGSWMKYCK
ncbi:unnamed protein product [Camellia sinensis]